MLRATQVDLTDGLAARSLPGRGRIATTRRHRPVRPDLPSLRGPRHRRRPGRSGRRARGGGALGDAGHPHRRRAGDRVRRRPSPTCPTSRCSREPPRSASTTTATSWPSERRPEPERSTGRLWHVRAGRIVIATGAIERPIVFADDDRPGIMLAAAAATYVTDYAVRPGSRAAIFTTNDSTDAVAEVIASAGRRARGGRSTRAAATAVVGTEARWRRAGSRPITIGRLDGAGPRRRVAVDLLLVSGGWNPNLHLWSQSRGTLRFDDRLAAFVPDAAFGDVVAVGRGGRATGLPDVDPGLGRPAASTRTRPDAWSTHYVDLQRDATVAHLRRALDAGLTSIEHVKRYTTIGTAADQGKTSGVVASAIAAAVLGQDVGAIGVPTFRPPYIPVSFGQLAGRERGDLLDPIRTTPIQPWHVAAGAVFEDVGQWKRPRYFPRPGETMDDGGPPRVRRRSYGRRRHGRHRPSARSTSRAPTRPSSSTGSTPRASPRSRSARAGTPIMCRLDGMLFDDGVVSRLGRRPVPPDDHDRQRRGGHGSSRGVPPDRMAGPARPSDIGQRGMGHDRRRRAARRATCSRALAPDLDVSAAGFPFMTWRSTTIGGDTGPRLPDLVLGRAGLRDQRRVVVRPGALGGGHRRRPSLRHHAVRDRGAPRAARREGLPDHRPGDRRHRDAARPRARLGGLDAQGLHRPAIAAPRGPDRAPDRRQLVALLPVDPDGAARGGRPARGGRRRSRPAARCRCSAT